METLSLLESGKLNIPYTSSLLERYKTINQRLNALSDMTLPDIINNLFPDKIDDVAEIRKLVLSVQQKANDIHELFSLVNTEITQPELPTANDCVLVLTLYKAKGLTAKMVVIANCLEGCIPHIGDYATEKQRDKKHWLNKKGCFSFLLQEPEIYY